MKLSSEDLGYVRQLREAGVLIDDDSRRLKTPNGLALVCCSDGDQADDVCKQVSNLAKGDGGMDRVHRYMNHGGAALLSQANLIDEDHAPDEYILAQMRKGLPGKNMGVVALVVHAPCMAADEEGLSIVEMVYHMFQGKTRLKEIWPTISEKRSRGKVVRKAKPGIKVACFVQVDYGDGKKRMYFVSQELFDEWYIKYEASELEGMGDDFEQPGQLTPDERAANIKSSSDDLNIEDDDLDPPYIDPVADKLVHDMRQSGEYAAVSDDQLIATP